VRVRGSRERSTDRPRGRLQRAVPSREAHLCHQPLVDVVEPSSVDPRHLRSSPTPQDCHRPVNQLPQASRSAVGRRYRDLQVVRVPRGPDSTDSRARSGPRRAEPLPWRDLRKHSNTRSIGRLSESSVSSPNICSITDPRGPGHAWRDEGIRLRMGRRKVVPEAVRTRVLGLRSQGLSWSEVADRLNDWRTPTGQGGARWYPSTARGLALRGVHELGRCPTCGRELRP
jgi:hypothetical protein